MTCDLESRYYPWIMVGYREPGYLTVPTPTLLSPSDRSVLRQRRCQPVSRKVHEGAEKGGNENQFPYSLPTTKFFKFRWGKRRNWYVSFSPVIPPSDFVSKTFLGDITFSPRSIREPDNSSQTHPPLPVCIGLDSVGVSATWVHFHLIPVKAGHAGNLFPFRSLPRHLREFLASASIPATLSWLY